MSDPSINRATAEMPAIEDPGAIFQPDGPINPVFFREAIRALMRSLPQLERDNNPIANNRLYAALIALAALRPRDEIELMLSVQALAAYHAAAAGWRLGMNLAEPCGSSIRHMTAAATAARTFDTLLKSLERRQVKPLPSADDRPPPRLWAPSDPEAFMHYWEDRCREQPATPDMPPVVWTPELVAEVNECIERERIAEENRGLDIANTEGIRPDGSIIMPECPTPQQEAYIARRLTLRYRRECEENKRKGISELPKIRPLRTGDLVE